MTTTSQQPHVNTVMRDGPAKALALAIVDVFCTALAEQDGRHGLGLTQGQVLALEDALTAVFDRELSGAQADALAGLIAPGADAQEEQEV